MGLVVLASAVDLWPSFASGMATPTSGPFQIIHLWTVVAKYVVSEHCDIAIGHIHRTYRAHHPSSIQVRRTDQSKLSSLHLEPTMAPSVQLK